MFLIETGREGGSQVGLGLVREGRKEAATREAITAAAAAHAPCSPPRRAGEQGEGGAAAAAVVASLRFSCCSIHCFAVISTSADPNTRKARERERAGEGEKKRAIQCRNAVLKENRGRREVTTDKFTYPDPV